MAIAGDGFDPDNPASEWFYGIGNALNNRIRGNSVNNALVGRGGDDWLQGAFATHATHATQIDWLTGDSGRDTFVIQSETEAGMPYTGTGYAIISDFERGADTVQLLNERDKYRLDTVHFVGDVAQPDGALYYSDDLLVVFQDQTEIDLERDATFVDGVVQSPGQIEFAVAERTVTELDKTVSVTLKRTGGTDGAVQVRLTSVDGSATAGDDFQPVSQTVTFADGDAEQTIAFSLNDDALVEGSEQFHLTLSQPTRGATLGAVSTQNVTIADNDEPMVYGASAFTLDGFAVLDTPTGSGLFTTSNGRATTTFDGEAGYYDVVLKSVAPEQGRTVVSLRVNGVGEQWQLGPEADDNAASTGARL